LSGAGPQEGELRLKAEQAGLGSLVRFPGFQQYPDLPAWYGLAEALVLASESDQWGLVVNEAMAAGLPVIVSSRCGCAPDLVREGENGLVFDPGGPSSIAEALGAVAQMDAPRRAAMGARSRQLIAAFSPEDFALGLRAAIDCAFARHRRRGLLTRTVVGALGARSPA
jgi:glycosyltransferase involved in cell wall biosynthesis